MATVGCGGMAVSSHVDRGRDFSTYRTFDWGPADALPAGDARLDANPLFTDYVHGAVERELAARGLSLVSGDPDLRVHYHATVADRIDVNQVDRTYGYCQGADCPTEVLEYEAGTIVVDLMDARSNRLVWRGWARNRIEAFLDDPDRMADTVRESVAQMLDQLPATLGR